MPESSWWAILPGLLVGGVGMAITMAPTTAAAMSSVPVDKAGVGSAVINSMRQVGGSLGIAIMGALVATTVNVTPFDPRYAAQFVEGYHRALHVGAAIMLVGAVVAVATIRKVGHGDETQRASRLARRGLTNRPEKKEDPRLRLRGSIPVRRLRLLWRSPRDLALRPSHAPLGSHLVKRLLQPTLASGSVARWPHCTSASLGLSSSSVK